MCDPTYGVGFRVPPRVQNLRVSARGVPVRASDVVVRSIGDLVIRVTFGRKRDIVSYTVRAPGGLDLYGLRLCHLLVDVECERRGYAGLSWEVRNFELLWDHDEVRLEGIQAFTWEGLDGSLERYYNRDSGLRREVRGSKHTSVQDLEALIRDGVTANTVLLGLNVLRSDISSLVDAVKGIQYSYRDMMRMFKTDHEAVLRLVNLVEELVRKS